MSVNYVDLKIGNKFPEAVNCVIEISKDSKAKYELDIDLNVLKLDRILISTMRYPSSYGFIPQTLSGDGDPLDVLVYCNTPIVPLAVVEVRLIGGLRTIDGGDEDYKMLGIPTFHHQKADDISDMDPMFLKMVEHFFAFYKAIDKKVNPVELKGWFGKDEALKLVQEKHEVFKKNKK